MADKPIRLVSIATSTTDTVTRTVAVDELGNAWELIGHDNNRRWKPLPALPVASAQMLCDICRGNDHETAGHTAARGKKQ